MGQQRSILPQIFLALITSMFFYVSRHAMAKIGTRVEIGWVWYDGILGSKSDKKLEGKLSSLGVFYPIPFVPSMHLGLNYSALNISKEVFITPPADARLEILGAEINFLYSVSSVLDFVFKVKQSLRSTGSYRFESPAEVVELHATGNRVAIGVKYLLVPISKMVFGLAVSREVFTEEGASEQKFNSRSLHIGFELLF